MATFTLELEPEAFWEMVTKDRLPVSGPSAGFMWTGRQGKNGWENYKTRAQPIGWLYQARRVMTMAGGAGAETGYLNITVPTGCTMRIISIYVQGSASAGSALTLYKRDEDNAYVGQLGYSAAGASRILYLPSVGTAATAHNNYTNSLGMIFGPGEQFTAIAGAMANTETLTVGIVALMSTTDVPTWNMTGSGGAPTLAASTISAANTSQAVYL